jgi:predicted lipid-binding transport protein (Tim44 family)
MEVQSYERGSTVGKTIGGLVLIAVIGVVIWLAMRLFFGPDNCQPPQYCPPGSGTVYHPEDHNVDEWHPTIR